MKYEYKAVRTYHDDNSRLTKAFNDGYEFVRASEYVPTEPLAPGYIEYILCKPIT